DIPARARRRTITRGGGAIAVAAALAASASALRMGVRHGRRRIASRNTARDPADYGERLTDPLPPPVEGHETARMLALLAPLGLPDFGRAIEAPAFSL